MINKRSLLFVIALLALIGLVSIVLLVLGYRPIVTQDATLDWNALNAVTSWVAIIMSAVVGLGAVFLQHKLQQQEKALVLQKEELEKLKKFLEVVTPEGGLDFGTWQLD